MMLHFCRNNTRMQMTSPSAIYNNSELPCVALSSGGTQQLWQTRYVNRGIRLLDAVGGFPTAMGQGHKGMSAVGVQRVKL
jgi:hypothetical protein